KAGDHSRFVEDPRRCFGALSEPLRPAGAGVLGRLAALHQGSTSSPRRGTGSRALLGHGPLSQRHPARPDNGPGGCAGHSGTENLSRSRAFRLRSSTGGGPGFGATTVVPLISAGVDLLHSPPRILIVDSDEAARSAMSGLLTQEGYFCRTANSAEMA